MKGLTSNKQVFGPQKSLENVNIRDLILYGTEPRCLLISCQYLDAQDQEVVIGSLNQMIPCILIDILMCKKSPPIQTCVKKYISLFMNQLTYLLKAPPCTV